MLANTDDTVCPNPSDIGTYIGMGLAVVSIAPLIAAPVIGAIISRYGYLNASMYAGSMLLAGSLCLLAARLSIDRRIFAIA